MDIIEGHKVGILWACQMGGGCGRWVVGVADGWWVWQMGDGCGRWVVGVADGRWVWQMGGGCGRWVEGVEMDFAAACC